MEAQAAVAFDRYRSLARLRHRNQAAVWVAFDVSVAQLRLISILATLPRLSVSELARRLGTSLPTASQAIDRLVESGYVTRVPDQNDRRRTLLELTPAGLEVSDASLGTLQPMRRWLEQLNPAELAAATQGFEALLRVAEAEAAAHDGDVE